MREARRVIRWAPIEHQPNLEHPTEPIPLGVVVEEKHGGRRQVILLGRIAGLPAELRETWGPFREIAANWFEPVSRSVGELMTKTGAGTFVVDALAHQWRTNVYVKQPENKTAALSRRLETVARECYEGYVGEKLPPLPGERAQPTRARPRINYMLQATV